MYVLIKLNDDGVLAVTQVSQRQVGKGIRSRAEDLIRDELAAAGCTEDIDYEDGDDDNGCEGRWAVDMDRWELWSV